MLVQCDNYHQEIFRQMMWSHRMCSIILVSFTFTDHTVVFTKGGLCHQPKSDVSFQWVHSLGHCPRLSTSSQLLIPEKPATVKDGVMLSSREVPTLSWVSISDRPRRYWLQRWGIWFQILTQLSGWYRKCWRVLLTMYIAVPNQAAECPLFAAVSVCAPLLSW